MRLSQQNWTPKRPALTPLIDVIFLLLLFFMLSSTFAKFGEVELTGGGAAASAQTSQPAFLQLIGETIRINGTDLELLALDERLRELHSAGTELVLISLDETATSQQFVDVYAAARAIPGLAIAVIE